MVIEGPSGETWVGRYHEQTAQGIQMRDVAIYEPTGATLPRPAWIERLVKFGIRVDSKFLVIPNERASRVTPLAEFQVEKA